MNILNVSSFIFVNFSKIFDIFKRIKNILRVNLKEADF
jgi:hypothetical protein